MYISVGALVTIAIFVVGFFYFLAMLYEAFLDGALAFMGFDEKVVRSLPRQFESKYMAMITIAFIVSLVTGPILGLWGK